jgi:hypothetical protein
LPPLLEASLAVYALFPVSFFSGIIPKVEASSGGLIEVVFSLTWILGMSLIFPALSTGKASYPALMSL